MPAPEGAGISPIFYFREKPVISPNPGKCRNMAILRREVPMSRRCKKATDLGFMKRFWRDMRREIRGVRHLPHACVCIAGNEYFRR